MSRKKEKAPDPISKAIEAIVFIGVLMIGGYVLFQIAQTLGYI